MTPAGLAFVKVEGLGNDFILIDERDRTTPSLAAHQVRALCDRHVGVGADGVLSVLAPVTVGALATMHLTNADGSVAEMCGNGLRCVSLFLLHAGVAKAGVQHVIDTGAGPRAATADDATSDVRVDMGIARFTAANIPTLDGALIDVGDTVVRATAVSMGNPHLVLEMEPDAVVCARIGPIFEHDARFSERTNVEQCAVRADGSVDVCVWERGVGLTRACGTGACAAVAVLQRAGRVPSNVDVTVRLPGGALVVRVDGDSQRVSMAGPARMVFRGVAL